MRPLPAHPTSPTGIRLLMLRLFLVAGCLGGITFLGDQGKAMGSPQPTAFRTEASVPAAWGGVQGHAAFDDGQALEAGRYRTYHLRPAGPAGTSAGTSGGASGLPASVQRQAALAAPLAALPADATLTDRADAATALGVDLPALARAGFGGGKQVLPNSLLVRQGPAGGLAAFHLRLTADRPGAAAPTTLYCIATGPDGSVEVAITHLGQVRPDLMAAIADGICTGS
ncbi:hypothetical protein [Maritimibacter alkaliphilus]|uniref:hypothetical protein n=1 Tax=Maritimibacter alkaliphilus TaxID=404236 RepID=UPI001C9874AF|nr:hypothetical protein [Maritimibacter alkaliphilus]MBY6092910.1 hypothetical protein [Maritimibacter alkaliphilus]